MTELTFAKQFLTALEARPARLSSDHVVDPKSYPAQPAFILPRMPQPKRKPTSRSGTTTITEPTSTTADATSPPTTAAAAEGPLATVTLKPTRATLPTYTLPAPVSVATTSIHDLKAAYAAGSGAADLRTDKIKILHAKKPVNDTKTIKDVLGAAAVDAAAASPLAVEFSVMVLGGGGTPSAGTPAISTPERVASPPVAVPAAAAPPPPSQPEIEMGEAPVAAGPEEAAGILQTDEFWADLKGFLVQRLKDEGEGEMLASVFKEAWQQKGGSA